ncbi:MAG: hypothetical protein ACE5HH_03370, partial [Candidatus Hydrothermarchaeales archaeon]
MAVDEGEGMRIERMYLASALLFILLTSFGGVFLIIETGRPSGSDINLHLKLADGWLKGDLPLFNKDYFNHGYPYPPAFHLSLALLSILFFTSPIAIVSVLQVVLYPLIYLSTFYLVYRKTGPYIATMTVLLLATSPAFWDRATQAIPQAIDLAVFPLAAYFFLEKRDTRFEVSAAFMFYNHFMYAALLLLSLFLYSLFYERSRLGVFVKAALLFLPLILIMGAHFEAVMSESRSINEEQEWAVLNEPLFAIKYLGYPLFFLLFLSLIHLAFKQVAAFDRLLLLWMASLMPMAVYFPDRFIEYVAQPLAILGAVTLKDLIPQERPRAGILFMLFIFALAVQYNLFATLIQNGEVFLPLD